MDRLTKAHQAEEDAAGDFNAMWIVLTERIALGTLRAFGYAPEAVMAA